MSTFLGKYSLLFNFLLILAIFFTAWLYPFTGVPFGVIYILLGLILSSYVIIKKHRNVHLQGRIARNVFIQNTLVELIAILLGMILAGLISTYFALIATHQVGHQLIRVAIAIPIGLLVGWAVGLLFRRASGRLVKGAPGRRPSGLDH